MLTEIGGQEACGQIVNRSILHLVVRYIHSNSSLIEHELMCYQVMIHCWLGAGLVLQHSGIFGLLRPTYDLSRSGYEPALLGVTAQVYW